MSMLLPARALFHPARFRRRRQLPVSGKIFVRKGQVVSESEVIGEAVLGVHYQYLDLGSGLGVKAEDVAAYVGVKTGTRIEAGDVIAGPVGSARRVVRAPVACTVLGLERERILLECGGDSFQLVAGFPGVVADLLADRGAVIESSGILLQGVWGNGHWNRGKLVCLAKTPQHVLSPTQLLPELAGALVVAGHCENPEALVKAESVAIGGLALSSLSPLLVDLVSRLSFPVMILEGFGKHPLNPGLFRLLAQVQDIEAVMQSEKGPAPWRTRPELLIQAPVEPEMSLFEEMKEASVGQRVRVTTTPYLGRMGALINEPIVSRLPNGIWAETGSVRLDSGEELCLPLANLETIEQVSRISTAERSPS
jgi:hypothetical protein